MGNQCSKEYAELRRVKSTKVSSKFKRVTTTIEQYDPMKANIEWEEVTLEAYQGELSSLVDDHFEMTIKISKDFHLIADDPANLEMVIIFNNIVWRLRTDSIQDFLNWKHIFIICRRPERSNSEKCEIDSRRFTFFRKKIQCKFCGLVVCKNCSHEKAYLHSLGYYSYQPVCDICKTEIASDRINAMNSIIEKHRFLSNSLMRRSSIDHLTESGGKKISPRPRSIQVSLLGNTSFIN